MYYYAFTIRCMNYLKYLPTLNSFNKILSDYKKKYTWTQVEFVLDIEEKKNGNHNVHVHGMISTPKKVMRNMMRSIIPEGYCLTDHDYVRSKAAWKGYRNCKKHDEIAQFLLNNYLSLSESVLSQSDEDEDLVDYDETQSIIKINTIRIV